MILKKLSILVLHNLLKLTENLNSVAQNGLPNDALKVAIEEYSVDVAYRIQGDVEISEIRSLTAFGSNMNLVAMISAAMWVKFFK